jgi:high-affinity iron transporter
MFLNSFGILVREGLEALLICTALAAAASKAGSRDSVRAIWQGAAAAIVVSIATAFAVDRVLHLTEADQEAIEGVTMLLAAVVLFYVSYWLLSKLEVARWMGYLRDRMVGADSRWAMGGVAFLAVYREGAETVLFYRALAGIGAGFPFWPVRWNRSSALLLGVCLRRSRRARAPGSRLDLRDCLGEWSSDQPTGDLPDR